MKGLRDRVLTISPDAFGIAPSSNLGRVWAALMEMGLREGIATLVCVADGTVSLYTNSGGGVIGAGARENVRKASQSFLASADVHLGIMSQADTFPFPDSGRISFYCRTFSGVFTGEADQKELVGGWNALSQLFRAGNDVLSEMRVVSACGRTQA